MIIEMGWSSSVVVWLCERLSLATFHSQWTEKIQQIIYVHQQIWGRSPACELHHCRVRSACCLARFGCCCMPIPNRIRSHSHVFVWHCGCVRAIPRKHAHTHTHIHRRPTHAHTQYPHACEHPVHPLHSHINARTPNRSTKCQQQWAWPCRKGCSATSAMRTARTEPPHFIWGSCARERRQACGWRVCCVNGERLCYVLRAPLSSARADCHRHIARWMRLLFFFPSGGAGAGAAADAAVVCYRFAWSRHTHITTVSRISWPASRRVITHESCPSDATSQMENLICWDRRASVTVFK